MIALIWASFLFMFAKCWKLGEGITKALMAALMLTGHGTAKECSWTLMSPLCKVGMQEIVVLDSMGQRLSTYSVGHKQGIHPVTNRVCAQPLTHVVHYT